MIPSLLTSFVGDIAQRRQLEDDQLVWVRSVAEASANELELWWDEQRNTAAALLSSDSLTALLDTVMRSPVAVNSVDHKRLLSLLRVFDDSSPWFSEVRLCDSQGRTILSDSLKVPVGTPIDQASDFDITEWQSDDPAGARAISSQMGITATQRTARIWTSKVYFQGDKVSDTTGRLSQAPPTMILLSAIRGERNQLRGFWLFRLDLTQLSRILLPETSGHPIRMQVAAPQSRLLFPEQPLDDTRWLVCQPIQVGKSNCYVSAGAPRSLLEEPIRRRRQRVYWLVSLNCLISGLAAYALTSRAIKPLEKLHEGARRLAAGERGVRTNLDGYDEISSLGRAFDKMSGQLEVAMSELESSKDAAIEAYHHRSRFYALMTHELRTPLNAIIGYSEMLIDEVPDLKLDEEMQERWREDLGVIRRSGGHLLEQINSLLDLSKLEAGKLEFHPERFDLQELLGQVRLLMIPLVERGVKLVCTFQDPAGGGPLVFSDRPKLRQILINLLGNAAKFTPSGEIMCQVVRHRDGLAISVQDSGPGIPAAMQDKVFLEYVQLDGKVQASSGLGLAVVKRFCEILGGTVKLTSPPAERSRGCLFEVELPLRGEPLPKVGDVGLS